MALHFWIGYVDLILGTPWDVDLVDAAAGLFFLCMLNGQIATMGPETPALFLWVFGAANAASTLAVLDITRRRGPRREEDGAFLHRFDMNGILMTHVPMVAASLGAALLLQLGVGGLAFATIAVSLVTVLAVATLVRFHVFWWRAVKGASRLEGQAEPRLPLRPA